MSGRNDGGFCPGWTNVSIVISTMPLAPPIISRSFASGSIAPHIE
jgi:hypothetical protein